jgi:hypothetical protein
MSGVPHENHGNSVAAWVAVSIVMVATCVASVGVLVSKPWLFWLGVALVAVGVIAGKVLQMAGFGMKRDADPANNANNANAADGADAASTTA